MDLIGTWGKFRIMSIGFGLACFCSILAVVGMGELGKSDNAKDKDGKPVKKDPMMGLVFSVCGICCCILISFLTMSAANSDSAAQLVGVGNIGSRLLGLGRD